jgi:hypothetical protein
LFSNYIDARVASLHGTCCLSYLNSAGLLPSLQLAYRDTEMAVLKVLSDILLDIDLGRLSALVLLNLSVAFGIVDHEILLRQLNISFVVSGTARHWFESYLSNRWQ